MNWHSVFVLYSFVFGVITLIMILANTFFENKKLLGLTFIPAVICLVLVTLIVGGAI